MVGTEAPGVDDASLLHVLDSVLQVTIACICQAYVVVGVTLPALVACIEKNTLKLKLLKSCALIGQFIPVCCAISPKKKTRTYQSAVRFRASSYGTQELPRPYRVTAVHSQYWCKLCPRHFCHLYSNTS
jgi:hypothetical protein